MSTNVSIIHISDGLQGVFLLGVVRIEFRKLNKARFNGLRYLSLKFAVVKMQVLRSPPNL